MRVGVLALQGDFAEHLSVLARLGAEVMEVRSRENLETCDALIIPGGESTTMLKLLDRFGLRDTLVESIDGGLAVFGTCAGGIVLAVEVSDGEKPLGVFDISVRRNGYGPQIESFETDVDAGDLGAMRAVFIRAPVIERVGENVQVLASHEGNPVLVRSGRLLVSAFHPELSGDDRLHQWFIEEVCR